MLIEQLNVIKCLNGYAIGVVDDNGNPLCRVTKIYKDKEKAQSDLDNKTFKILDKCKEGCLNCAAPLKLRKWGIINDSDLPEHLHKYFFSLSVPDFTELGKIFKGKAVNIDVTYDDKLDKIIDYVLYDENDNIIKYNLNDIILKKLADWVVNLRWLINNQTELVKDRSRSLALKIEILKLAKQRKLHSLYNHYWKDLSNSLHELFKPDVVDLILLDIEDKINGN